MAQQNPPAQGQPPPIWERSELFNPCWKVLEKETFKAQGTEGEPFVCCEVCELLGSAPNLSHIAQGLACYALGSSPLCLCWLEMLHPTVLFHLLLPEVTCNDLSERLTWSSLTRGINKRMGILPPAAGPALKMYHIYLAKSAYPESEQRSKHWVAGVISCCRTCLGQASWIRSWKPLQQRQSRETSSSVVECTLNTRREAGEPLGIPCSLN